MYCGVVWCVFYSVVRCGDVVWRAAVCVMQSCGVEYVVMWYGVVRYDVVW